MEGGSEPSRLPDEKKTKKWPHGKPDMQTLGTDAYTMEGKERGKARKNTRGNPAKA